MITKYFIFITILFSILWICNGANFGLGNDILEFNWSPQVHVKFSDDIPLFVATLYPPDGNSSNSLTLTLGLVGMGESIAPYYNETVLNPLGLPRPQHAFTELQHYIDLRTSQQQVYWTRTYREIPKAETKFSSNELIPTVKYKTFLADSDATLSVVFEYLDKAEIIEMDGHTLDFAARTIKYSLEVESYTIKTQTEDLNPAYPDPMDSWALGFRLYANCSSKFLLKPSYGPLFPDALYVLNLQFPDNQEVTNATLRFFPLSRQNNLVTQKTQMWYANLTDELPSVFDGLDETFFDTFFIKATQSLYYDPDITFLFAAFENPPPNSPSSSTPSDAPIPPDSAITTPTADGSVSIIAGVIVVGFALLIAGSVAGFLIWKRRTKIADDSANAMKKISSMQRDDVDGQQAVVIQANPTWRASTIPSEVRNTLN